MIKWSFSPKNDQSRELSDSITDSKFNINPFGSFTREIIQNSLDVLDDEHHSFVRVIFEHKRLKLSDIPRGNELKNIIERCVASTKHQETLNKYKKALEILKSDEIPCLKVSDYNTKGLNEEGWETLVNKVGASYKPNDSSAGRHGIGKKASFLMSLCNTVFYTSKNLKDEVRIGGKSILTDWMDENENWYSLKGWYGNLIKCGDSTKVEPIMNKDVVLNDFFIRKEKYGTDVIIVALKETEDMKKTIINSVLENFYLGIKEQKLEVVVNDVEITAQKIDSVIETYYSCDFSRRGLGSDNIVIGLLKDYDLAYKSGIKKSIPVKDPKGTLDMYITLENKENRKYYSFYREHGMKIRDYPLSTDKSFSAVVVARGRALNEFLLKTENAAHDDFIADENNDNYKEIKTKLRNIISIVEEYIRSMTKLETSDSFLLEELNDMITYYGDVSKKKKNKNQKKTNPSEIKAIIQHKTNKQTVEEWTKEHSPFDIPSPDHVPPRPDHIPNPRPLPVQKELEKESDVAKNIVYEVSFEKFFVVIQKNYFIKFNFASSLRNVRLYLVAKNVDGSMNDVTNMLQEINIPDLKYKVYENCIYIDCIPANQDIQIKVTLKNSSRYKLFAKLQGVEDETNV